MNSFATCDEEKWHEKNFYSTLQYKHVDDKIMIFYKLKKSGINLNFNHLGYCN